MKGCVAVETYLAVVVGPRSAALVLPIVFASSNVNDYTEGAGAKLRFDVAWDSEEIDLGYTPSWDAAKHALGL